MLNTHPDKFAASFTDLHLLKHPFYQEWMAGTLTKTALQDYAAQYYYHVDRFPRYIGAIYSQCENTDDRRALLENLNDEEGNTHGVPHPELWLRFAEGMGAERQMVATTSPRTAIQNVTYTFFSFARSSFAEGLGALYAYESQVPEIAESKIDGLKSRYGIHDERTLEFFSVHQVADQEHRAVIRAILEKLPADQQELACKAAKRTARALWDFLSDVQTANPSCACA
jgi:pyrroloquinoline-quinone synthase